MRKTIVTMLLATIISGGLLAQSIDDIKDMAGKNQWAKAKDGVDKYLAVEKNAKKADGWYMKALIYNNIAKDSVLSATVPTARMDAFMAYKKYIEIDPKAIEGTLNQHATLFDVAFGYLKLAASDFNAKKFEASLSEFKDAETVQTYITQKGFTYGTFSFPAYDTQLYVNIAAAAVNAKKEDIGVEYYQKLADKKIVSTGYDEIYKYLVDQFRKRGDKANTDKYMALGKELYPKDDYWLQVEVEMELAKAGGDKRKLLGIYEQITAKYPTNYLLSYNYAVELFNYSFVGDKHPDDAAAVGAKLPEVLKKTIAINSTSEANMLLCRYYFSLINDQIDAYNAIKGVKPDDIKKKKEINDQTSANYENMLPYATAVYTTYDTKTTALKGGEKGTFKIVCSMLAEYWERKGDKVKMKQYQDRQKSIE